MLRNRVMIDGKVNGDLGNIVLYNSSTHKISDVSYEKYNLTNYPINMFIPIGVVAIPKSHDVYGTGECGVISLKAMNYQTPDNGGSNISMYWGCYHIDTSLPNMDGMASISSTLTSNYVYSSNIQACLPSTNTIYYFNSGGVRPSAGYGLDTKAGYYPTDADQFGYAPSPYLEDGSRNPSYYASITSYRNGLSDFDGMGNTETILSYATGQTDWKTSSSINDEYMGNYAPPHCCCWRYHTSGTSQGDWYLPAMGELGYMIVRFQEIQNTLNKINTLCGASFSTLLGEYNNYWSSSEYGYYSARLFDASNGRIAGAAKINKGCVRAFIRF